MSGAEDLGQLLAEQLAYYRAAAPVYESLSLPGWGGAEVAAALEAFAPRGNILELACGPGMWTQLLARHASSVTAVDGAPEMLARARARAGNERVQFVEADLFSWRPERRYDVVFFGFWLSHVPPHRFEAFWSLVDEALVPGGRVFFADDAVRGAASSVIQRRLDDGRAYRIVKVPYSLSELETRLAGIGWRFTFTQTSGGFFWGSGGRNDGA